jgi:hypothetical protein
MLKYSAICISMDKISFSLVRPGYILETGKLISWSDSVLYGFFVTALMKLKLS